MKKKVKGTLINTNQYVLIFDVFLPPIIKLRLAQAIGEPVYHAAIEARDPSKARLRQKMMLAKREIL